MGITLDSRQPETALVVRTRRAIRALAVVLTALVTLLNFASLVLLVKAFLADHNSTSGQTLLLDAVNIWLTNVIAFALWFWSIDRGGPAARGLVAREVDDFLCPQMTVDALKSEWSPSFADYLYVSSTNATAFSPTDTMPLTARAKLLMMVESVISLLTIALLAARAVNIFACRRSLVTCISRGILTAGSYPAVGTQKRSVRLRPLVRSMPRPPRSLCRGDSEKAMSGCSRDKAKIEILTFELHHPERCG